MLMSDLGPFEPMISFSCSGLPSWKSSWVLRRLTRTKCRDSDAASWPPPGNAKRANEGVEMRSSFLACIVLMAGSAMAATAGQQDKWIGRVSDTRCGRTVNTECNRKCINDGIPPVLVLDGTDEVVPIANPETVKR